MVSVSTPSLLGLYKEVFAAMEKIIIEDDFERADELVDCIRLLFSECEILLVHSAEGELKRRLSASGVRKSGAVMNAEEPLNEKRGK